jgi:hypothetical protein
MIYYIYIIYMRTIIDIPDDQAAPLAEVCQRIHISRAEAVRRGIALFLRQNGGSADDAYGLWKDRKIDGVEYQQALRKEWGE